VSGPLEARKVRFIENTDACLPVRSRGQTGNKQPDLPVHAALLGCLEVKVLFLVISSPVVGFLGID